MWFGKGVVVRGREGGGGGRPLGRAWHSGAFPPSAITTPLAHSDSFWLLPFNSFPKLLPPTARGHDLLGCTSCMGAQPCSRAMFVPPAPVPVTPRATRHASMHLHRVMACLATCVLCNHEPALAVVGGRVVSADELAARGVVGLRSQAGRLRRGACTGTLIAPNLVLTARHCLDQAEDGPLTSVIFGGSACGTASPCWCHSFGPRLPCSLQVRS